MDNKLKLIADTIGQEKVKFEGQKLIFVAFSVNEIIKMVSLVKELKVPFTVVGLGTKSFISDEFSGVIIKNRTKSLSIVGVKGKVSSQGLGIDEALVEVESGVSINRLVEFLSKQGLQIAHLVNLPGTLGGNLFLNKALQDSAKSIKVLEDEIDEVSPLELSIRKHIVLSAVLRFKSIK